MAKEDTFGCCGSYKECLLTGKCENSNLDYSKCMLYRYTISFKFPTLYKLKQKGYVSIEDNRLTTEGIKLMEEQSKEYDRLYFLLVTIFILGLEHSGRTNPDKIYKTFVTAVKTLNI